MASKQPPTIETLLATANTYLQIFTSLDPAAVRAITSPKYTHTMAPASLGITSKDKPPMDQTQFASHLGGLRGIMRTFPVVARETWPNPTLKQVVVWADSWIEWHEHVKDGGDDETEKGEWGSFSGEYIFVLFMDESGTKVERCLEFLDGKATETAKGLIGRALKRKAAVEGKRPDGVLGMEG